MLCIPRNKVLLEVEKVQTLKTTGERPEKYSHLSTV